MTYKGHVQNGVILLDEPIELADGSPVLVLEVNTSEERCDRSSVSSLSEALGPFVGSAEGLPEDMALNHDHYLHGSPKK